MSKNDQANKQDAKHDDPNEPGELVNDITPVNEPEPVDDPSWTHDDDDEGGETSKPDTESK